MAVRKLTPKRPEKASNNKPKEQSPDQKLERLSTSFSLMGDHLKDLRQFVDGLYDMSILFQDGRHAEEFYGVFTYALPMISHSLEDYRKWAGELEKLAEGQSTEG